jgi:iron complex outermembrane recepter protein
MLRHHSLCRRLLRAGATTLLAFSLGLAANAATAEKLKFDIPAQSATSALRLFAQQAGMELLFSQDVVNGVSTREVIGEFAREDALKQLLTGTDLRAVEQDGVITIKLQETSATERSPTAPLALSASPLRLAQNSTHTEALADSKADSRNTVEEVTVFGRGERESVRDIPQTVTAFDEQMIQNVGAREVQDVVRFIPTATSQTPEFSVTANSINIRGFEASYTVNGMAGALSNTAPDLGNVERVEVLMGPASVLYGSMEPGGIVNIVTKKPQREFHFAGSLDAGSFNRQRYGIDIGGPLSDGVRTRLNASFSDGKSFINNWERERIEVAPSFEFDLTDATVLRLDGAYTRAEWVNGAYDGRVPAEGSVLANAFGEIPRSFSGAEPELGGMVRSNVDVRAYLDHRFTDNWSANASVVYSRKKFSGPTFFVLGLGNDGRSGRRSVRIDDDVSPSKFAHVDLKGEVSTGPIVHKLIIGVDHLQEKSDGSENRIGLDPIDLYAPIYGVVLPDPLPVESYVTELTASGAFLQDRIQLNKRLNLIAGVRYSRIRESGAFFEPGSDPESSTLKQSNWASQFGVLFDVTDSVALFAARNESFVPREGTTSEGHPFEPEKGLQYEVGSKFDIGSTGLTGNVALFQIEKPNVLANDPFNIGFLVPLGAVRSRGVEASASGTVLPGWGLFVSYAHLNAEVTSGTEDAFAGKKLSNAPSNTAAVISSYDFQSGWLSSFGITASAQYVADRFADSANVLSLPSYTRIDLSGRYALNEKVDLSVGVNNLGDEDIYTGFQSRVVSRQFGRIYFAQLKMRL